MNTDNSWLLEFAAAAKTTDRLPVAHNHTALLAAGLMGEAGSVAAEVKKEQREREAYPAYRHKILEEIGDVLWYFVRLTDTICPTLLPNLTMHRTASSRSALHACLDLGAAIGDVVAAIGKGESIGPTESALLGSVWST